MSVRSLLLVLSVLSSGLTAGLFFGWAVSVIPGTRVVDDQTYVSTMQNINREIINPAFILAFIGTPFVLAIAAVVHFRAGNNKAATALVAAAGTYVVGVLAVTMGGNVPLNNALEAFDPTMASVAELHDQRTNYETRWNRWHNLRTVASVASLVLAGYASTLAQVD